MRQPVGVLLAIVLVFGARDALAQPARPVVGLAFGGGSARGIAHIGVIKWFEENHIPIDVAAGTSMGGLVGGAFATGMSAAELRTLITGTDWDLMFGSSSFPFKNVRRKEDARSYPSRLEFGLKKGSCRPRRSTTANRSTCSSPGSPRRTYDLARFDDLPTPFRVVSVDLLKGEKVVMSDGPLATALRATMSLPGIFPPVKRDGRVLVDGGALDNIPADVVKSLGATEVIAIDVGYAPTTTVDYSMFGLLGLTVDAMMRSATRIALASATMTIAIDVEGFGSLDWRKADELITRGYQAAEKHREELLKFRVSDARVAGVARHAPTPAQDGPSAADFPPDVRRRQGRRGRRRASAVHTRERPARHSVARKGSICAVGARPVPVGRLAADDGRGHIRACSFGRGKRGMPPPSSCSV